MSKHLVLFHGKPKKEKFLDPTIPKPNKANWFPYVMDGVKNLGITTYAPLLPRPYDPDNSALQPTFDSMPIHEGSMLAGHSLGARIILEGMTRREDLVVDKLILVAPWTDPRGNYSGLGDLNVDPSLTERSRRGMTVFYSSQDDDQALESLEIVRDLFPKAKYRDIPEYGHFMLGNTMQSPAFPEFVEELGL